MGIKVLAAGTAAVLLGPGCAVLGVATLVSAPAAGSSSCMWAGTSTGSLTGVIDGTVPATLTVTTTDGRRVVLTHRQLTRAAAIVAVGTSEGVPARAQLVALVAALTESSLRVLSNTTAYPRSAHIANDGNGGDHDSLGLFQQRPAAGWGTVEELMNPVWSARAFYGGPDGPNHGSPRGLLDIPRWQTLSLGAAAQAVEVSAYPDRYAANAPVAAKILAALTGITTSSPASSPTASDSAIVPSCSSEGTTPPSPVLNGMSSGFAGRLIRAAASQLGTPYVWGGGNLLGPTGGGFDCSGLVLYAAYQASQGRIRLAHYTGDQIHAGTAIAWADKQPGDLIFFSYPGAGRPHHVAIYLGGNRIIQAPHTGDVVRYGTIDEFAGQHMTVRRLADT